MNHAFWQALSNLLTIALVLLAIFIGIFTPSQGAILLALTAAATLPQKMK